MQHVLLRAGKWAPTGAQNPPEIRPEVLRPAGAPPPLTTPTALLLPTPEPLSVLGLGCCQTRFCSRPSAVQIPWCPLAAPVLSHLSQVGPSLPNDWIYLGRLISTAELFVSGS